MPLAARIGRVGRTADVSLDRDRAALCQQYRTGDRGLVLGRAQTDARYVAALLLLVFPLLSGGSRCVGSNDRDGTRPGLAVYFFSASAIDNGLCILPAACHHKSHCTGWRLNASQKVLETCREVAVPSS